MEICANCAAKLDPSWKFCIKCGTPVPAGAARRTRDEPIAAEAAVPAAAPSVASVGTASAVATKARVKHTSAAKTASSEASTASAVVAEEGLAEDAADDEVGEVYADEESETELVSDEVDDEFTDEFTDNEFDIAEFARTEYAEAETEAVEADADAEAVEADADAEIVATEPIVEVGEPTPSATVREEPTASTRRTRSPFAPPTPAPVEDELDDANEESLDREPVLPIPVIPAPDRSASETPGDSEQEPALEPALAHSSPSINDLGTEQLVQEENPFSHDLPPRPQPPQSRAEAKAAAAERAAVRARNTAAAKAEIRAKYPIGTSSAKNQEYTEESLPAFRTADGAPARRKLDVPLVVSISLSTAGVVLIVYLAILVFGARG